MLTLLPKGVQTKYLKLFLLKIFSICHKTTPVVHIELRISPRMFKKIKTVLMKFSWAWGKPIHEKNLKSKISWHSPIKETLSSKPFFYVSIYISKTELQSRPLSTEAIKRLNHIVTKSL
jgi:hypothetical protein